MALPKQSYIDLPLLLEMERQGGTVPASASANPSICDLVARHFSDLSSDDRQLKRSSVQEFIWDNAVGWARDNWRKRGAINGGQRGVWEITAGGRQQLRAELQQLGIPGQDVEHFIRSSETLQDRLGTRWNPLPSRKRRVEKRPPPVPEKPAEDIQPPPPSPMKPDISVTEVTASQAPNTLLERILSLDDRQFEHLVRRLLQEIGMSEAIVTGRPHDGGIDGIAKIAVLGVRVVFQAKKWSNTTVGVGDVQRLVGAVHANRHDRGVLITTSSFSAGAKEEAEKPDSKVSLIDGSKLIHLLVEKGLGIKSVPLVKQEIDEDFFKSLGGGSS